MSECEVVPRSQVPAPLQTGPFFAGKVFAALIEVAEPSALKVKVANSKIGLHLKKRLNEIADKERLGKTVHSTRSKDGKEFFFWLEKNDPGA